ncbi:MAG: hypothetical protein AAB867_02330, partial [Patescibacteria group bacterium]
MKKLIVGTVATLMIFGFMALPQAGRAQTTSAGDNTSALFAKIQELQNQINALKERLLGQSKNSAVPSVGGGGIGVAPSGATQVMPSGSIFIGDDAMAELRAS